MKPLVAILFIGNSLTYSNDLPNVVASLARAAGQHVKVEAIARPDFSLEDHWNQGDARRAIAKGGWTYVVLQQGPSALSESRVLLVDYTKRFDKEIQKAGARTALYMVWPSQQRRGDFPGVSQSYSAAAQAVKGLLLPAGDAWRAAWEADTTLPLYSPDGLHPSAMGTYLAALVIYQQLMGQPPPAAPILGCTPEQAAILQRAARQVVSRQP